MARGGKRAQRARSLAQSGGKATTFQGGKGGGVWQSKGGGSNSQRASNVTQRAGAGKVTIRKTGGDNSATGGGRSGRSKGKVQPNVRKGAARGQGGSHQ